MVVRTSPTPSVSGGIRWGSLCGWHASVSAWTCVHVCVHSVCMKVWVSSLFLAMLSKLGCIWARGRGTRVPHVWGALREAGGWKGTEITQLVQLSELPLPCCDVSPSLGSKAQLLPLCSSKGRRFPGTPWVLGRGSAWRVGSWGFGGWEVGRPDPWAKGRIKEKSSVYLKTKQTIFLALMSHTLLVGKTVK